jgi:hypothetical protein
MSKALNFGSARIFYLKYLTRDLFFDFGLGFLKELRSLVISLGHIRNEFSGLERHVEL